MHSLSERRTSRSQPGVDLARPATIPRARAAETERKAISYHLTKDPVHLSELNATILHLMGIDHRRLTYKFQGLDQRLTGVEERHVIKGILA